MNDDRGENGRGWLDRLIAALNREPATREELVEMLRDAESRNLFDAEALSMIEGVLQVAEMRVRDIMVPRAQMVVIEEDDEPESFVTTVVGSGHSRFPVIGDNRDEVEGIFLQFTTPLLVHLVEVGTLHAVVPCLVAGLALLAAVLLADVSSLELVLDTMGWLLNTADSLQGVSSNTGGAVIGETASHTFIRAFVEHIGVGIGSTHDVI